MPKTTPSSHAQLFKLRQLIAPAVTIGNPDAHGWCALLRSGKFQEGRIHLGRAILEVDYSDDLDEDEAEPDEFEIWEALERLNLQDEPWEERGWELPDSVAGWASDNGDRSLELTFRLSARDFEHLLEEFKSVFGLIKPPPGSRTGLIVTTRRVMLLGKANYTEGEISRMSDLERTLAIEHHYGPEALQPKRAEGTPTHTIRMFSDDLLERVTNLGWSEDEIERMDSQDVLRVDEARLGPAGLELDDKGQVVPAEGTNVTPIHWPGWLQAREREP